MSVLELKRLYLLHEVDAGLAQLQAKANGLDIGQVETKHLQQITREEEEASAEYKLLSQEQKDLELKQSDMLSKASRFEKDLYGGKVVNPREVESYEKEIVLLRNHAREFEDRLLELMEVVPIAEQKAKKLQSQISELKETIAKKREIAIKARDQIKIAYENLKKTRPERAKDVDPDLLEKYESIRKQHHGIGLARVKKDHSCEACGMRQADRTITHLLEGHLIFCEACKRILYYSEGAI